MNYIILGDDLSSHGFYYKKGMNVNPILFDGGGGLCFSDKKNIAKFLDFGTKIATVMVPDDAKVYNDGNKWKADKIIISDIVPIGESNLWDDPIFCKMAVEYTDGNGLVYMKEQTEEICKVVVGIDGLLLEYVNDKTMNEEICKIAVEQDGVALMYVNDKTMNEEICKIAVEQYGHALEYVPEEMKTEEICKIAVTQYGMTLRFVPEEMKTKEICKIAVEQTKQAFQYVPDEIDMEKKMLICGNSSRGRLFRVFR